MKFYSATELGSKADELTRFLVLYLLFGGLDFSQEITLYLYHRVKCSNACLTDHKPAPQLHYQL